MNAIRNISLTVRNAALVAVAVILGFAIGGALGFPVSLQAIFLLPATLLFYRLTGEDRPPIWKMVGFFALLSAFVLIVHLGLRYVPDRYFWIYYIVVAFLLPFGSIVHWFERRFHREKAQSEQAVDGNPH